MSSSDLMRDGHRKALPSGKRTSATGHTYYENRRNRTDKGKVGSLYLAKGGAIPNNYEGKTPSKIWNSWTEKQKEHFLSDHYLSNTGHTKIEVDYVERIKKSDYTELPINVVDDLKEHIKMGQYANGGMMNNMSVHEGTDFFNTPVYKKGGEIEFENSNLRIVGSGLDINGNRIVKVSLPNQRAFSIQTNGTLPYTHRLLRNFNTNDVDLSFKEIESMENEITDYVKKYGSEKQKKSLKVYRNSYSDGGDFMSGVYAEEGAEVTYIRNKDGIRVKSVAKPEKELTEKEWMAKHNESPEARSYASGGDINANQLDLGYTYNFEKDEDNLGSLSKEGGVYFVLGFENGKHFSESFEKFADAKKFYLSKKNSFAFGGATEGIFTSYTGTHYTGEVGETNALSSGELFAKGGRIKKPLYIIHDDNNKDTEPFKNLRTLKDFEDKANELGYTTSIDRKRGWIAISKTPTGNDILIAETLNPSKGMFADGGAVMQNQQFIKDATTNTANMFASEGLYEQGGNINTNTNKMKKRLEKGDDVLIIGRRWFDRVNGNTYHTAEVQVNGDFVGKSRMTYGYDEQYLETGKEILLEHYELPVGMTERSPLWQLRDYGVVLHKYAIDGLKRELASGGNVVNERRHVNKEEDYEVRYARKNPVRNGYKGKHEFADGGFMDNVYAKGGKVSPFENMMKTNTISEKEINLIKLRMNNDKVDEATQEAIDYIWDEMPELTPDQDKKGIDYLRNLWKSPTGKERTNNPFGYREQEALENFSHFALRGFYDAGNRYNKFYVPLYVCFGKDTSFEYYVYGGSISIVG